MDVIWIIFLFVMGACVGSFLNVVIYRLPRGESIAFPGSHCPSCGRAIRWYDNIPLLSWLALGGRCRFCKTHISPRYLVIELVTALLVGGLYVCYYIVEFRRGAGEFEVTWPMFIAHAALVCGLLACSAVDIEKWIVPLEVCWFVSVVGVVAAAAAPWAYHSIKDYPWMLTVSPASGAMAVAGAIGLVIAIVLQHYGLLQQSFLDAVEKPVLNIKPARKNAPTAGKDAAPAASKATPRVSVAITAQHGVNPRKEVLREVLFLAPAIGLAVAAYFLVTEVPAVRSGWNHLTNESQAGTAGAFARHFNGLLAAIFGYLVGGAWIWGTRIIGTLAFGKEAMGLGDVHIMAAVGAVAGWTVPTLAFFVAPVFGLAWALYLWIARNQRELPYGPWLAGASVIVMIFYDRLFDILRAYIELISS